MTTLSLDDIQRFTLMKFRRTMSDVTKPHHDDFYLVRWLTARNWNPEAAEKMLRESLQWRQFWEVDEGLKTWKPPEALELYYPSGSTGCDVQGIPIIFVPFGNLDLKGILLATSKQDVVRLTVKLLEDYLEQSGKQSKVVVVFDMTGFNLRDYAWRPAAELAIALVKMYEANYPEILKACFIINAPTVFAVAFSVVRRFLNEYTLSKIHIFKNDPPKWTKVLQANIPASVLPKCYGGDLVDPDGDPACPSKIHQGGKVPKSLYKNQDDEDSEEEVFTTVTIKKGRKLTLDFIVPDEGSVLKWNFRTENHDIKFGITYCDEEGQSHPAIKFQRVASHQMNETGVIACKAPATYLVIFDNSYSILRSKKLHYRISVLNAEKNLDTTIDPTNMPKTDVNDKETTDEKPLL